jgi:threonine dehydratase
MPSTRPSDEPRPASVHRLSLERIARAHREIDACFLDSPILRPATLSAQLGCELVLKDESANPIGCFKGRGASSLLHRRVAQGDRSPMVCASAGNFGMAMAHACASHRIALSVFVSRHASAAKVDGIRRLGATVVVAGEDFDDAKAAARAFATEHSLDFVEDGVQVAISEGAGSAAVELLRQAPGLDAVLVPLGNGALLAGIARWIKAQAPSIEVIGVCSTGASIMQACWRHGAIPADAEMASVDTIADGIAVRVPVAEAVQDLAGLVDDVVCVDDPAMLAAMRWLHHDTRLRVEPSAVVGIAAIAAQRARFSSRRVATLLTGRNLTHAQADRWYG